MADGVLQLRVRQDRTDYYFFFQVVREGDVWVKA